MKPIFGLIRIMTTNITDAATESLITNVLGNRVRRPGRHYLLSDGGTSLAIDITGQPYVDRKAMSARAVISTATIDRVGDVLIPQGCQLSNFAKNPVVLWAHGLEGIGCPIATSRDPNGDLSVTISDTDVQATAWFSQSSLEAAQIFELIDEGIVRATSVRETPIKSHIRRDLEHGDVVVVEEWDLEEWSWCAVGVNPDAVAKALDRNRLGGHPISPSILKSLSAVAPAIQRYGRGLPMEKILKDTSQPVDDDDANVSTDDSANESDDEGFHPTTRPYGSTVVSAAHASLDEACRNIAEAIGPLENPVVKESLQGILTLLEEQVLVLEGLHSSNYPNQPQLKDDSADGDDSGDGDQMKAFLASGQVATLPLFGVGNRLKGLIVARNLTRNQRRTLTNLSQQWNRLISQAKSHTQVSDSNLKNAALQRSIEDLEAMIGKLRQ